MRPARDVSPLKTKKTPPGGEGPRDGTEVTLRCYGGRDQEFQIPVGVLRGVRRLRSEGRDLPETCPACGGRGRWKKTAHSLRPVRDGEYLPRCNGAGKVVKEKCPSCGGAGRTRKTHRVEVKIPAGVDTGTRLRIAGEGEPGINGGSSGDLYLLVSVAEHPDFKRDGADLHTRLVLSFPQAALGCTVQVAVLSGEPESLSVPAGTQPGRVFTLRGKGIPRLRGARGTGDLHVHVVVDVPKKLTDRQRALLEELAREMQVEVEDSGVFGKFFRNLFDS